MRIGIVGGGHTGIVYAGYLAHTNNEVSVFTSKPNQWSKTISIKDKPENSSYTANLHWIGNDYKEFAKQADLILMTIPAYALAMFAKNIAPYIGDKHTFILSPGTSGREYLCNDLLQHGAKVAGLQRVIFISRIITPGKSGELLGTKPEIVGASVGNDFAWEKTIETLFNIPVNKLPTYLPISLLSSNPILHSSRLKTMIENNDAKSFAENPLFYKAWDNTASELFINMDKELIKICQAYSNLLNTNDYSLAQYYDSTTPSELTAKISSISAFQNIKSPMLQSENKFYPDYSSRYFTEDILFGLRQIYELGLLAGLNSPNIANTISWAENRVSPKTQKLELAKLGFHTFSDIEKFYRP